MTGTPHRTAPGVLMIVLATVALASVAVTLVGLHRDPEPVVATDPPPVDADPPAEAAPRPEVTAAEVLAAWDVERAAAWAAGDVRRLRALYTPGSVAGDRDVAMLRRWLDRGLTVTGLRTQVLALREDSRTQRRLVLTVTDRLLGGVATGRGTTTRLPADSATSTTVTLQRRGSRWLVSSVR